MKEGGRGEVGERGDGRSRDRERCEATVLVWKVEEGHRELTNVAAEKQGNGFFPPASRKEHTPTDMLILVQQDPCQTFYQQNCKKINLNCLKPLIWWSFITTAIGK